MYKAQNLRLVQSYQENVEAGSDFKSYPGYEKVANRIHPSKHVLTCKGAEPPENLS